MNDNIFPPFTIVAPFFLQKASDEVSVYLSSENIVDTGRWRRLLNKLGKAEPLTQLEKVQLINNYLSIPEELKSQFMRAFMDGLDKDTLDLASRRVMSLLAPSETIMLLSDSLILERFGHAHLPPGVYEARELISNGDAEAIWVNSIIDVSFQIGTFLCRFAVLDGVKKQLSQGQKRLAKLAISSPNLSSLIKDQYPDILDTLAKMGGSDDDSLKLIDRMLHNYFSFDQAWSTKVLDNEYFLRHMVTHVDYSYPSIGKRLNQYKNISLLKNKIVEIANAIELLNKAEPDRGNFWKNYLSQCQYVEAKRIDSSVVGTAFAFSTFVIVDYGPKGNAALLYDRKTFEESIRSSSHRWRDEALLKSYPPYTNDGRLIHRSNWQREFNHLIVFLLSQGEKVK